MSLGFVNLSFVTFSHIAMYVRMHLRPIKLSGDENEYPMYSRVSYWGCIMALKNNSLFDLRKIWNTNLPIFLRGYGDVYSEINSCPIFCKIIVIRILSSKVIIKMWCYFSEVKHANFTDATKYIKDNFHGTFTILYGKISPGWDLPIVPYDL